MIKEAKLPEISENVDSGEVLEILVAVDDMIEKDQPIVELETEKAAFEVPAPESGKVTEIDIEKGQTVNIGQTLLKIETEAQRSEPEKPKEQEKPKAEEEPKEPEKAEEKREEKPAEERAEKAEEKKPQPQEQKKEPQAEQAEEKREPVPAAPSVRQLARELGIDIEKVKGTGPGERISDEDVKRTARELISSQEQRPEEPGETTEQRQTIRDLPDFSKWGQIEREELSVTRKKIIDNLSYSWSKIPLVTQYDHADFTALEEFRQSHSRKLEKQGIKLTVTAILLKILAEALKRFPQFNASLDEKSNELVIKQYYHIGVAVDTDRGLLVPVIRDVNKKGISVLAGELAELAKKARDKKISPDEMMGGSFTLSNLGGIGGGHFSPVVYWPQTAILGVGRAEKRVKLIEGEIHERMILPLCVSYDHRVIDGADGARFIHWIVNAIEQPYLMLMEK